MLKRLRRTLLDWLFRDYAPSDPALVRLFGLGTDTASGEQVSEDTALRLAAVWACVNKIAKTVAQIPLQVLQANTDEQGTTTSLAKNHPLYRLLHSQWNPYMTSYQARQMMQATVCLHGNAVAEIEWNNAGQVKALWPWPHSHVRYETDGFAVRYFFRDRRGTETRIPSENILHLRGLVMDGALGLSPIAACRESVGEGFAAQKYGARFYKNNARPGGVIEYDGQFSDQDAEKRFRRSWQEAQSGDNVHKVAILPQGMKFVPFAISNEDAQFLETRKFNRTEIAAIFDVPPHMIGDLEKATYSNIEHQSLEAVIFNFMAWFVNWEQTLTAALLSPAQQRLYEIKHNVDGLLRGDTKSRWEAHQIAYLIGAKSPNEIRAHEGWNPRPGGDRYVHQANLVFDDDTTDEDTTDAAE